MRSNLLYPALIALTIGVQSAFGDDNLVVNSINLVGFNGCDSKQQNIIKAAWNDAVKIVDTYKDDINFNEAAALEYLGPPVYNQARQANVKAMFTKLASFGQGSKWTPTWFKWKVGIRCDDEPSKDCAKNPTASAYTMNMVGGANGHRVLKNSDRKGSTPVINFCKPFWTFPSLKKALEDFKGDGVARKFDLGNYRKSTSFVMLHELFHMDSATYEASGNKHVRDNKFKLADDPNGRAMVIYGAKLTKIAARTQTAKAAEYVTNNADNLANYALAKFLTKALGAYPHLPIVEDVADPDFFKKPGLAGPNNVIFTSTNGQLQWNDAIMNGISDGNGDDTCDGEDDCPDTQEIAQFNDASLYPAEYIQQVIQWSKDTPTNGPQDLPPISPDPLPADLSLECQGNPLFANNYASVSQNFAQGSINKVCDLFAGTTLASGQDGRLVMPYKVSNTDNTVWLSAAWNEGDPACAGKNLQLDAGQCKKILGSVLNDCDTDTIYFKFGGTKVDQCVVYDMSVDGSPRIHPLRRFERRRI